MKISKIFVTFMKILLFPIEIIMQIGQNWQDERTQYLEEEEDDETD